MTGQVRYRSPDEDSARWLAVEHRPGDIVISTRSKHGTTWLQMICALLILQTPELPAPLAQLSPWVDWLVLPLDDLVRQLAGQQHRRFLKTHTPLDGLPPDPRVTYLVGARHPLDAAVSLYHQGDNLDRQRISELTGVPDRPRTPRPPLAAWLAAWVEDDPDPVTQLDSLPGVLAHLTGAWQRRVEPSVVLVHYDDLTADLEGEMRRLADRLQIAVPGATWPDLVTAAGFAAMRGRADRLAPDPAVVLKDRAAFFRRGRSGAGRELLTAAQFEQYLDRAAALAPPDLLEWLHRAPVGELRA